MLEGIGEQGNKGLIKKKTNITTYTEIYFQNKENERRKVKAPTSYKAEVGTRINHFGF